jgi:adenine-specific DNA methylase
LIYKAKTRYILVSYNNTGEKRDGRSNARISDKEIIRILETRGKTQIFEKEYRAFSTGKSETKGNTERVFFCEVINQPQTNDQII